MEATEWNCSGTLLTPDLAEAKECPELLWCMDEGTDDRATGNGRFGSSAQDKNSSWAVKPAGTRLEEDDFDT